MGTIQTLLQNYRIKRGWKRICKAYRQQILGTIQTKWSNPLSIYSPDKNKLAVVMFNADLHEHSKEIRRAIDLLREDIRNRKIDWNEPVC